ncbi:MAG: sigma-70 family RNA polymerase sigma factor [Myxococcales bacterium]|nr:sigma-70 family RNA polymerase sigma factor [Myxococcales bacterium]
MAQQDEARAPALLRRFSLGEGTAFFAVYRAHAADVRQWASRFFSSPFEQEEAVQEIWLTVHRMSTRYQPEAGELRPWLRALAANRCKELLRAKGRRPSASEELSEELPLDEPGPEHEARRARAREAVTRFARSLPEHERMALSLSLVEERSHEEVALALGISVRRSKYLRRKVLARAAADPSIRQALAELEPEGAG